MSENITSTNMLEKFFDDNGRRKKVRRGKKVLSDFQAQAKRKCKRSHKIRNYVFIWHPFGIEHELYLSGSETEFKKLNAKIKDITTPPLEDSEAKECLLKEFEHILRFVKDHTELKVVKVKKIPMVQNFIFESGNGKNQVYTSFKEILEK